MALRANFTDLFIDPISLQTMTDPVTNTCGHSYDRDQIEGWIASRVSAGAVPGCPLCRRPIGELVANVLLRRGIEILNAPFNDLAESIEDLNEDERDELGRAIEHIRQRRQANIEATPSIPDRLSEAMVFFKGKTRATSHAYCPELG